MNGTLKTGALSTGVEQLSLRNPAMNDNHKKKMIAPVIVTVIFFLYLVIYLVVIMFASEVNPVFLLFAGPLIGLGIAMVYTLKSRINEIRSGEEDDLSDY
jgi:L-asparagine transporter-like permease